jgi:hypothetical protein
MHITHIHERPISKLFLCFAILGIFLNGRTEKLAKQKVLTKPALERIWNEPSIIDFQGKY